MLPEDCQAWYQDLGVEKMVDESLETVSEDLEDITLESVADPSEFPYSGEWSRDNPLPVEVVIPSDNDEDAAQDEVTIRFYGEETNADPVVLEEINVYSNNTRASGSTNFKNLWTITINGTDYDVLFPAEASLEVVNGKIYNTGSGNITGLVIDGSFSDSSFSNYTFTILPVSASNTQNTVYRYGSRMYITRYSTATGNTLTTTVSYVQANVKNRPAGWSLTPADMVISGLLLLSVLVTILGGLFRR